MKNFTEVQLTALLWRDAIRAVITSLQWNLAVKFIFENKMTMSKANVLLTF